MLNLKVHEYNRIRDGSRAILTKVNPYICLSKANPEGGSTRVFIQGGKFYHEGGKEYRTSELPSWLNEEIAKLTPQARKEIGLVEPPEEDE
jgi:hypothetical protein